MTTSTSSASATGLPDRRHFLSTIAGAGALSLPALPTITASSGGDAHLFALGRQLATLQALAAEADRQLRAVEAGYEKIAPRAPEALIVRPDDKLTTKQRPEMRDGQPTGRFEYDVDVEKVKRQLASWSEYELEEIRSVDPKIAAALVRLREIVDSHTAWREARHTARKAAGMPEAEEAADEAFRRCIEVMSEIAMCPATTLAGVMLKARTALRCLGDTFEEAEVALDEELDGSVSAESLALSIVKDLAQMAARNATGGFHA